MSTESTDTWLADDCDDDSGTPDAASLEDLNELLDRWEEARESGRPVRLEDLTSDPYLLRRAERYVQAMAAFEQFSPSKPEASPARSATLAAIGPYEVIAWIGSGSSCDVFLCHDTELDRVAAVKICKGGKWAQLSLEQFRREVDLLVSLRHPGIVHLFDAGRIEHEGVVRPWFAMELVHGAQLGQFLKKLETAKKSSIRRCLRLFLDICDAVSHAHQRGVVHCDLKPSNILVDASEHVRVIDFGIAQIRNAAAGAALPSVRAAGTPPFMAPERFENTSTAPDVQWDVYGLGVTLYRMLTGRFPYRVRSSSFAAWRRAVTESVPTSPRSYHRHLDADLEAIMLKAIAVDPTERYSSVNQLAEDIRRYLEGLPVAARPIGPFLQLARWARRNPVSATFGLAIFVVLLITTSSAVFYASQAGLRAQRLERMTYLANRARDETERSNRRLKKAQSALQERVEQLATSQANMALWLANDDVAVDPHYARTILMDPRRCPPTHRSGFVWRLLEKQTRTTLGTAQGHLGSIYRLATPPGSDLMASTGADGYLRVWRLPQLELLAEYRAKLDPRCQFALGVDGTHVVLINRMGDAVYIDLEENRHRYLIRTPRITASAVTICPWTGRIAVADQQGMVRVWSRHGRDIIARWDTKTPGIVALQFDKEGRLAAVAEEGEILVGSDLTSGTFQTQQMPLKSIDRACFDPTLRYVLAMRLPRRIVLWDREEKTIVEDHLRPSTLHEWSVGGSILAGSPPNTLVAGRYSVTNVQTGQRLAFREPPQSISDLAADADGRFFVVGDSAGALQVESMRPQKVRHHVHVADAPIRLLAFQPGKRLVLAGIPEPPTVLIRRYDGKEVERASYPQEERLIALLEGKGTFGAITQRSDGMVLLRDPIQCKEPEFLGRLTHRLTVGTVCRTGRDGQWVAATRAGTLVRWDDRAKRLEETRRIDRAFRAVTMRSDRRLFAVSGERSELLLVDADTLNVVARKDQGRSCVGMMWSPTNDLLATVGKRGIVQLLDAATLQPIADLRLHSSRVTSVVFSPDGKLLATGDTSGLIVLWDTHLGEPRCRFHVGKAPVISLAFSSDGECLVAGDTEGNLMIWDATDE